MFASYDSKVVYRSGSILGYPDTFRYKQVAAHKVNKGRSSVVDHVSPV